MMIRLNCFIQAGPGKCETVLDAARSLTEASVAQEGCIAYDIFTSATRPDVMMICETWRDHAALDAHSASAEFIRYVGVMRENAEMKLESFEF